MFVTTKILLSVRMPSESAWGGGPYGGNWGAIGEISPYGVEYNVLWIAPSTWSVVQPARKSQSVSPYFSATTWAAAAAAAAVIAAAITSRLRRRMCGIISSFLSF